MTSSPSRAAGQASRRPKPKPKPRRKHTDSPFWRASVSSEERRSYASTRISTASSHTEPLAQRRRHPFRTFERREMTTFLDYTQSRARNQVGHLLVQVHGRQRIFAPAKHERGAGD